MPTFIEYETSKPLLETGDQLSFHYCVFRSDQYTDTLFSDYCISFPASLKNAVIKRRAEFLAGRYCAAQALKRLGINDFILDIGQHRNPLWPAGLCGSISHSQGCAVAVVDPRPHTLGLGIDIEEIIALDTIERVQSQILYGDELGLLTDDNQALLFTLAFSAKESFFKAAYPRVQKYFDFDAVAIVGVDLNGKSITLKILADLCPEFSPGKIIVGRFDYLSATKIVTLLFIT